MKAPSARLRNLAPAAGMLLAACASRPAPEPESPRAPVPADSAASPPGRTRARDVPLPPVAAAAASRAPRPSPVWSPRQGDAVLFRVDGRAVTRSDVGDFLVRYHPAEAGAVLAQVIDEAVVLAEAAREGVTLDPAAVSRHVEAVLDARRREARVQFGPDRTPDALLEELYGRPLPSLRLDVERLARATLFRDRLVRLDPLRRRGVEVRVLVLPTEPGARAAAAQLRAGADMTLFASRAGLPAPAAPPPLAPEDVPDAALRAALFGAEPGTVLDPLPFAEPVAGGPPRVWWQVFKVVRTWEPSAAPWAELAAQVEASLAAAPVGPEETARWRERAFARHRVERLDPAKGFVPLPGGE